MDCLRTTSAYLQTYSVAAQSLRKQALSFSHFYICAWCRHELPCSQGCLALVACCRNCLCSVHAAMLVK